MIGIAIGFIYAWVSEMFIEKKKSCISYESQGGKKILITEKKI
jgi:hypothetical protein